MLKRKTYPFITPFSQRSSATPSTTPGPVKLVIDEPFEKALRQAEAKISNGDLSGASRLITPYLPLLTAKQKKRIVNVLDPYAENMFRKAYILKAFDREASDRMMSLLSKSGLDFLPSIKKAGKLITHQKN